MRFNRIRVTLTASCVIAAAVAVAGGGAASASNSKKGISVLYSYNYVQDTDALANAWWKSVENQWKTANPSTPLTPVGVGGTDIDEMNKAAILFRSPSTTPCVIQMPTTYVGEFASSGYLASLNSYVSGSSAPAFWTGMPKAVQEMSTIGGKVYAVNLGNTDGGIVYNKLMLEKAGIKMPWVPKTWADIIAAAKAVHKAEPKVYALWAETGVASGPTGILQGVGNLIFGSTNPQMFDSKTGKWVVDSPGLAATLKFYQTVAKDGLGAPVSQLLNADSLAEPPALMQKGKLAISFGANWFPSTWLPGSAEPWPAASKDVGAAPMPTENGQAPGIASTIGGWAYAISATCTNKASAFKFITLLESPANQLSMATESGFIPPDTSVATSKAFDTSSLFQLQFSRYAAIGTPFPNNANFTVYTRAINTATEDFAINPNTETVSSALSTMKSLITQQLGSNSVETIKSSG